MEYFGCYVTIAMTDTLVYVFNGLVRFCELQNLAAIMAKALGGGMGGWRGDVALAANENDIQE